MNTLTIRFNFEGEIPQELKKFCTFEKSESYQVTAISRMDEFARVEDIEQVTDSSDDAYEKIAKIEEILSRP